MTNCLAIAGTGRLGRALAILLWQRGVRIAAVAGRSETATKDLAAQCGGAQAVAFQDLASHAPTVLVCVSDDAIGPVAHGISAGPSLPDVVLHTSAAQGPDALSSLAEKGVATGVLHPLQTVPSSAAGLRSLPGSTFASAGAERAQMAALELIEALNGRMLRIEPQRWPLYHAAAVMASNYQVALVDAALELMHDAGVERAAALAALSPLIASSAANVITLGPEVALTGPIRRGDIGTVLKHVEALRAVNPEVRSLYAAAGVRTVGIAARCGLPSAAAQRLGEVLSSVSAQ